MTVVTLHEFVDALRRPGETLSTLGDAVLLCHPDGSPRVCRTTDFAEAAVEWRGATWLVCAPLGSRAWRQMLPAVIAVERIRERCIAPLRVLYGELRSVDATGVPFSADLLLQELPAGLPLDRAAGGGELLTALDRLQAELRRIDVSHNNLKPENIRVRADGSMCVIHNYRMTRGAGGDDAAFAALRRRLAEQGAGAMVADVSAVYAAVPPQPVEEFPGHLEVAPEADMLVRVRDTEGYGFVDEHNRTVIASQYCWAEDFHEGRAVAEVASGVGVIDKRGRWVVEPRFDEAAYDERRSVIWARRGRRWQLFDYMGRELDSPDISPVEAERRPDN